MGSWSETVVLLLVAITAVPCSSLIKEKEPEKGWPDRNSVKQPYTQIENVTETESLPLEPETENREDTIEVEEVNPEIIAKSADLTKNEAAKVDYSGAQLWKVSTEKTGVRVVLTRLRRRNLISTWGGNQSFIDVLVKSNAVQNVSRVFQREKIPYEIVIDDLQQRINDENPPLDENEQALQDRRGHRMTWKQYHRLEDIYGFMDYLAKTYPSIINVQNIGKSYEGRNIKVLRISDGKASNKAVFIDGGIHAREWISPATVTYFINQFAENFDVESDDIKNIDWYFVPVVNPDGYEFTHIGDRLWRKNRKPGIPGRTCSGTDLNRNFGYRWGGKGASNNPCSEIYRGSRAFSEPETKALSAHLLGNDVQLSEHCAKVIKGFCHNDYIVGKSKDFIKNNAANFTAYLTYHSYGQYLLYPWGYDNAVPPDYEQLNDVGTKIAQAIQQSGGSLYSVGSSSGLLYPAAGGSDDWAKSRGIKYTYTIELSDTGRFGFVLPTSFIEPVARENLAGLRVLASEVHKV